MDYTSIDFENEPQIEALIEECGGTIRKTEHHESREAETLPLEDLHLSEGSAEFLAKRNITALWKHQHLAIKAAKEGRNVCITTSTSSGKTEIFLLSCMEILHKDPTAKVLAVYPMRALNTQQLERWKKTGLTVGKIQGGVPPEERLRALECDVVVITPDTIHAFLLAKLSSRQFGEAIRNFIAHIAVIVVDELHLYKGYFGTNSAYLFRRLNNVRRRLRGDRSFPLYITASATLPAATEHSFNITGAKDFLEIGEDVDGSPESQRTTYFVSHNKECNAIVGKMVRAFADVPETKSITFVAGRQQTGTIAKFADTLKECESSGIIPFQAGYETQAANVICQRLNDGDFKGVISTSALEIGIDIEGVNVVIIYDLPQDYNSYRQRIGRAGRFGCDKSYVIVVKGESLASSLLFASNHFDVRNVLPFYEPALYLEDRHIQAIHAFLHVGSHDDCEDTVIAKNKDSTKVFNATGYFPGSFIDFCNNEVLNPHKTPKEYKEVEKEGSDNPHGHYQVRFFGNQFKIEPDEGEQYRIPAEESISREQIATEGYRGAVRHTMFYDEGTKRADRVVERIIGHRGRGSRMRILARKAKRNEMFWRTVATRRVFLFPKLIDDARHSSLTYGRATFLNLDADEVIKIYGYAVYYPNGGIENKPYEFPENLPTKSTTATVIFHPAFNENGVRTADIADILLKTFILRNAFDSQDIKDNGGRIHGYNETLGRNAKFVSFYDNTPLNLSQRLMDEQTLQDLFSYLRENEDTIISNVCPGADDTKTLAALDELIKDVLDNAKTPEKQVAIGPMRTLKKGTFVSYAPMSQDEGDDVKEILALFIEYDSADNRTAHIRLMVPPYTEMREVSVEYIQPTDQTEYD